MQKLEIIPSQGIGVIKFGARPDEVMAVFGSELVYEDWMGGNLNNSLSYHGLVFRFNECDSHGPLENSTFGELQVWGREDASLYGKSIHNWTKQELIQYCLEHNIQYGTPDNGDLEATQIGFEASFSEKGLLLSAGLWRPE
jgi:hypothetical protein